MFNAKIVSLEQTGFAETNLIAINKISASLSDTITAYDEKSGVIEVSVELNDVSSVDIQIDFQIQGTATGNGVDYSLLTSSPITISKGSKNGKIRIQLIDDGLGDAGETIIIKLLENDNINVSQKNMLNLVLTESLPSLVSSSTKLVDNLSNSYVDLDIDWSRGLAYLASRKTNVCVDVIDFNNIQSPIIVKTVGSASLQSCLGVKLFDNNTKILLSSLGSNKLAAWNLTSNPIDFSSWFSLGEYPIGSNGKRIAKVENSGGFNTWNVYSTKASGVFKTSLSISGSVGTFTLSNSYNSAVSFNASTVLGNKVLAQSYTGSTQPINFLSTSLVLTAGVTTSFWGWAAITNTADSKAFLGGGPGGAAFFGNDAGTITLKKKIIMPSTCTVRGADFAYQGAKEYLYTICANGFVDVFDVTDIDNPILVNSGQISPIESEAYGIKIKPNSNLGIVITNKGDFIVLNLLGLLPVSAQYPAEVSSF